MLHPFGSRSGACAPRRCGLRGPTRRRNARHRRQDVRHAASDRGETRARLSGGGRHIMSTVLVNEFNVPDDHVAIREGVRSVVTRFGDDYWLARDEDGGFPFEFHRAMADAGWLGITLPEEYGGSRSAVARAATTMSRLST